MKKILQARLTKITEGDSSRIGATIDLGMATAVPDTRERLSKLENEYELTLEHIDQLRRLPPNPISKWRLADELYRFLQKVRNWNIDLESHLKTLCRDTGISRTELKYLMRFRKTYTLRELDGNIQWSTYRSQLYSSKPYGKPRSHKM